MCALNGIMCALNRIMCALNGIMCALTCFVLRLIILCTSDLRQRSGQEQLCVSVMMEVDSGRVVVMAVDAVGHQCLYIVIV